MYLNLQDTSFNDFMLILLFSFCQEGHYEERLIPQEFHTFIPDQTSLAKLNRNPISDVHLPPPNKNSSTKISIKKKKKKFSHSCCYQNFEDRTKISPQIFHKYLSHESCYYNKIFNDPSLILSKPIKLSILPSNANKKTTPL